MNKDMIAMVDDEKELIETYSEMLSEKYDVITFDSPKLFFEYLDKFQDNPFKVLISDYNMGSVSGLQMVKKLKDIGKACPFIMMSGYLDKNTVMQAHESGAHRILEKPVPIENLELAVKELIVEGKIEKVRKDMRELTIQLKEVSSYFDIIISQYAPEEEINKFFISLESNDPSYKFSTFREFIDRIEQRLYVLLKSEEILHKQLVEVQRAHAQALLKAA